MCSRVVPHGACYMCSRVVLVACYMCSRVVHL